MLNNSRYFFVEQANAVYVPSDCYGPCEHCQQTCQSKNYTGWFCADLKVKTGCCCTPPKKKIFRQSVEFKKLNF